MQYGSRVLNIEKAGVTIYFFVELHSVYLLNILVLILSVDSKYLIKLTRYVPPDSTGYSQWQPRQDRHRPPKDALAQ